MNLTRFTAFYDACVLYPAPLRDLLMQLGISDIFHAKWSNQVHDEWIRNALKNRPDLNIDQLERVRNLMNAHAPDSIVEDFEFLIECIDLPDPDDRHVLAAAYHSRSDVIVTFNLKDFPGPTLARYHLEAKHPDEFLINAFDINPDSVLSAVKTVRNRLKKPPIDLDRYISIIGKQRLPVFCEILSKNKRLLGE